MLYIVLKLFIAGILNIINLFHLLAMARKKASKSKLKELMKNKANKLELEEETKFIRVKDDTYVVILGFTIKYS